MRKSKIHRGQSKLSDIYIRLLENEIGEEDLRKGLDAIARRYYGFSRMALRQARAARLDGGEHARLMSDAQIARYCFGQVRLLEI